MGTVQRDSMGRFVLGISGNKNGRPSISCLTGLSSIEKTRNSKLIKKYGISIHEYNALLERQGGVCALCGQPEIKMQSRGLGMKPTPDSLHVDHDHRTGKVRGLLCYRCNTGIGKLLDNPDLLRKAADYLEGK